MVDSDWRVIISKDVDPFRNMAVEEALLSAVDGDFSQNTLRFWKNKRSAIIGISERVRDVLHLDSCLRNNVLIVRRFTGGGTVYHDLGNLNWSIVCKKNSRILENANSVTKIYENILNIMVFALRELNIGANINYTNNIFCFGKKISGSSMYIKRNAVLCHGTLLVNSNLNVLRKVLRELKYPVMNINEVKEISDELIIKEIINGLEEHCLMKVNKNCLTSYEENIIKQISLVKYVPKN